MAEFLCPRAPVPKGLAKDPHELSTLHVQCWFVVSTCRNGINFNHGDGVSDRNVSTDSSVGSVFAHAAAWLKSGDRVGIRRNATFFNAKTVAKNCFLGLRRACKQVLQKMVEALAVNAT